MLEPSLHRRRHTVLDISCRVRLSSCFLHNFLFKLNVIQLRIFVVAFIATDVNGEHTRTEKTK